MLFGRWCLFLCTAYNENSWTISLQIRENKAYVESSFMYVFLVIEPDDVDIDRNVLGTRRGVVLTP